MPKSIAALGAIGPLRPVWARRIRLNSPDLSWIGSRNTRANVASLNRNAAYKIRVPESWADLVNLPERKRPLQYACTNFALDLSCALSVNVKSTRA